MSTRCIRLHQDFSRVARQRLRLFFLRLTEKGSAVGSIDLAAVKEAYKNPTGKSLSNSGRQQTLLVRVPALKNLSQRISVPADIPIRELLSEVHEKVQRRSVRLASLCSAALFALGCVFSQLFYIHFIRISAF